MGGLLLGWMLCKCLKMLVQSMRFVSACRVIQVAAQIGHINMSCFVDHVATVVVPIVGVALSVTIAC